MNSSGLFFLRKQKMVCRSFHLLIVKLNWQFRFKEKSGKSDGPSPTISAEHLTAHSHIHVLPITLSLTTTSVFAKRFWPRPSYFIPGNTAHFAELFTTGCIQASDGTSLQHRALRLSSAKSEQCFESFGLAP